MIRVMLSPGSRLTLTRSDSVIQEFEVRRVFVLKSCINIPGGIGRTLQELSSLGVSGATEFPLLESQLSLSSLSPSLINT